jgi:N-acetylneuraminic acid mutarotase
MKSKSAFKKALLFSLILSICIALALSFTLVKAFTGTSDAASQVENSISRTLSIEQRIAYQRLIEEVYWRHRIWPAENTQPKPALDQVMPASALHAKVEDYLRKSSAFENFWRRPITAEQLQAEINRLTAQTKKPEVLAELFTALNNDAFVIAECLARPLLTERLIRSWYSYDERFHSELKAQVQSSLSGLDTGKMRLLGESYTEIEYVKASNEKEKIHPPLTTDVQNLTAEEWNTHVQQLARLFRGKEDSSTSKREKSETLTSTRQENETHTILKQLPIGTISPLQEEDGRFYIAMILKKNERSVKVATIEWRKKPFEDWWESEKKQISATTHTTQYQYWLPAINSALGGACNPDQWTAMESAPRERDSHTAVWTGTEMIIWGGRAALGNNFLFYDTGGRYNPSTDSWTLIAPFAGLSARASHSAVWTGTEMIVWGGTTASGDTNTGARYNPSSDTWTAITLVNAPDARNTHTAIWTGNEMIIWGGSPALNTGGRYTPSSNTWTTTSTASAPGGRVAHTAVWTGTEMIIWGGTIAGGDTNTGGRYNPSNDSWVATSLTNVPGPRRAHVAVWTGSEMIVCSGWFGNSFPDQNTGGRYNPASDSWLETSTGNSPRSRNSTAVWTGSEMIVFGGVFAGIGHGIQFTNETSRYTPATNTWLSGNTPNMLAGRVLHTAVWTGSEMIVFGGSRNIGNAYTFYDNGARYNPSLNSWTSIKSTNSPPARYYHTAIWTGSEMIVWGGFNGADTGGRYSPVTGLWTPIGPFTINGASLTYHTAVWTGTEMIIWGGRYSNTGTFNSGSRYNPASNIFTPVSTTSAPAPRYKHTAIWTGSEMIVWGGTDNTFNEVNTGGKYNPSSDSWTVTSLTNVPTPRELHKAVWTGSVMVVWGGVDGGVTKNTGARYTPASDSWSPTITANAPNARINHTAIWTGTEMIVWGGESETLGYLNTGGRYNPGSNAWTSISTINAPSARRNHSAVWTGTEMIVWGGYNGNFLGAGAYYTPSTDTWLATNPTNEPRPRAYHSAVWTDTEMIVWGGQSQMGNFMNLNDGARYCGPVATTCTYSIAPTSQSFTSTGGTGSVDVTANLGCTWTAVSSAGWIHVTSGNSGNGNGVVSYSVDNNPGAPRTGQIVIAGQNFTVMQSDLQSGCIFSIAPVGEHFGPQEATGVVNVTTQTGCNWSATSNAGWIHITTGTNGTGNGIVSYSVDANSGGIRSGTLLIAGQTFTLTQAHVRRTGNIAPFDFDDDGKTDISIWRPSTGTWFILKSSSAGNYESRLWGIANDVLVPGDYDGDGETDTAVWRPSNGVWFILFTFGGNPQGKTVSWGINGDVPVPGDYDGDGKTDIAIWRPSTGVWYIINSADSSITTRLWGESTDIPVVGDYDNDGKSDIAQWRPANGRWFIINSGNGSIRIDTWGIPGDKPVPGDYDGDGRNDLAIWRLSTGIWYIVNSSNSTVSTLLWGENTDKPVPGDYDGDGKTDIAQWRPSNGRWFVVSSSGSSFPITTWGMNGDIPVPGVK